MPKTIPTVKTIETPDEADKPQSKGLNTCCLIGIIVLAIISFFLVGLIVVGVIFWKTYGPQFVTIVRDNLTNTISKQSEEQMRTLIDDVLPSSFPTEFRVPTGQPEITPAPLFEVQSDATGEQILPESDSRNITRQDVIGLTPWELKVARNEIYARHGRPFVHKDMQCYFRSTMWYAEDSAYTDSRLTSLEQRNAVFILNYEKEIGSPIWGVDTGCR